MKTNQVPIIAALGLWRSGGTGKAAKLPGQELPRNSAQENALKKKGRLTEISKNLMTYVMQRADVRVIQAGNSLGFAFESLLANWISRKLRGQNLDRHCALQPRIARAIHLAHAASP